LGRGEPALPEPPGSVPERPKGSRKEESLMFYWDTVETPRGVFTIVFHEKGIYRVFFPGQQEEPAAWPRRDLPWRELKRDLPRYLAGEKVSWEGYPLDESGYSDFTRRLLRLVRTVPYGVLLSYRQAAEKVGSPRGCRAVGQALKRNRHPILVPCHRIIRSSGEPGGFSGPPGWKEFLLALESARYTAGGQTIYF
jgi:methylated-DNA-[protein]-cysteine S-methyltransferase